MTESLKRTTIVAWLIMLAASLLPNIIGQDVAIFSFMADWRSNGWRR